MQVEERTFFRRLDANLLFVILALNVIGLINLYSATHGITPTSQGNLFWQQLVWLVIGWSIFFGVTLLDYKLFKRAAYILYFVNILALGLVLVAGHISLGARRWL